MLLDHWLPGFFPRWRFPDRSGLRQQVERLEDRTLLSPVELISVAHPEFGGNAAGGSLDRGSAVSADGRFVVFTSTAGTLVSGLEIVPGVQNVYRMDRQTGEILLVSINADGNGSGNGNSFNPAISADGSIVAFQSDAGNLHPLETGTEVNVFARNLATETTHLVSISNDGNAGGNGPSGSAAISGDGSVVAYVSRASNLHPLDTDALPDVLVRNLVTNTTHLVTVNVSGNGSGNGHSFAPVVSADGSVVAFVNTSTNLHPLATDADFDVFARDLTTNTTHLVSINAAGNGSGNGSSGSPALSADGSVVAFVSSASNLHPLDGDAVPDVFVRDLTTNSTHLVSVNSEGDGSGNLESGDPVVSADGTLVAFQSDASNLHPLDADTVTDLFARDLATGTTHLVSLNAAGNGSGNAPSGSAAVSADGSVVAFRSAASNLHPRDTDILPDIFARDLTTQTTHLVSLNTTGTGSGNGASDRPVISADGSLIAFQSDADNLVANDFNGERDVFARDLQATTTSLEDILLFDAATGRWHRGLNVGGRFEQQLGHRWSTAVTWDFHHGDFTGDGLLDVAGRQRETGQWFVFSATENGGFTTTYWGRWGTDETAGWTDVLVGDFNGDGRDDIVGRVNNNQANHGQIWVAESTGERFNSRFYGNWAASGWASTEWIHVVAGDFNNDGKDGIAGMRDSGHWFFAQTNEGGRFTTTLVGQWSGTADWRHVMSADFTGDGRSDLVGQTATGQWWIGASQTTSLHTYFGGTWTTDLRDVVIGDFDGDGLADIAGWHASGDWRVLRSAGLGERMTNELWGWWGPAQDWTPVVGDFTGNGRDDIAGYEANSGQIWVAVSTGESFENQFFGQWDPLGAVGFAASGRLA